jgi:hypothetical protein
MLGFKLRRSTILLKNSSPISYVLALQVRGKMGINMYWIVPSTAQKLKSGDIINVDITLEQGGYIADSSKIYLIGHATPVAKGLVDKTYEAMW